MRIMEQNSESGRRSAADLWWIGSLLMLISATCTCGMLGWLVVHATLR